MPTRARTFAGLLLLAVFSLCARAQGNMTIEHGPEKVRHLAGVVTDAGGQPFFGAVVEDCDPHFKEVLHSVTTDPNGRFAFSSIKYGSKHYLSVRVRNMNLDHRIVMIGLFAKSRLKIELYPGT